MKGRSKQSRSNARFFVKRPRVFEIWAEGYRATGDSSTATKFGEAIGTSFREACITFAMANPEFHKYFNADSLTYWGCGLFDNERDARKAFG